MTTWAVQCLGIAIAVSVCTGTGCTRVKTHPDPDERIRALEKARHDLERNEQAGGDSETATGNGGAR